MTQVLVNSLVVTCQMYIIFLQGRNFFLYRLKNGANRQRWMMFLAGICLFCHSVIHFKYEPMYFLLTCSLIGVHIYEGYKYLWQALVFLYEKYTFKR